MKEELFERGMNMAQACRNHYDRLVAIMGEMETVDDSIREASSLRECLGRLSGFCEGLAGAGVFTSEDVKKLVEFAIPASVPVGRGIGLPAEIMDFVKGLDQLDDFGHKE